MPKRYIIDTSVLLRYPQILSRSCNRSLIVPEAVLEELARKGSHSRYSDIAELVAYSVAAGVSVENAGKSNKNELIFTDRHARRLPPGSVEAVRLALFYADQHDDEITCVVSNDKDLTKFLTRKNITVISAAEFLGESEDDGVNPHIEARANKVVTAQKRFIFKSLLLGFLGSAIAPLLYKHLDFILSNIPVWGTMISIPLLGLLLFWYRENFSLSYGAFEFCIGVLMASYIFFPHFSYSGLGLIDGLQVIGGLYVMVRGLDNISRGVVGTRLEAPWRRLFYRRPN